MGCFLAADYMRRFKSLCFLAPWSDLVKLYYIMFYLTNEKFLTTGVL